MSDTPDILKKIVERKLEEIDERSANLSIDQLKAQLDDADAPRGFVQSLNDKIAAGQSGVIAEIKKASPSKVCCVSILCPLRLHRVMRIMARRVYRCSPMSIFSKVVMRI